MANITGNNIVVFPSAKRANANTNYVKASRALSEANLIGLVNQLLETKSFVVSNSFSTSEDFIFNIGGYLFTIKKEVLNPSGTDMYAHITMDTTGDYDELNWDETIGLVVDNTSASNDDKNLHILTKVGNNYVVPEESKLNLIDQIIDGGTI